VTFPKADSLDASQSGIEQKVDGQGPDDLEDFHPGEELDGNLSSNPDEQRLPRSVLDMDQQDIKDGMLVDEAFSQNLSSFMPDMMFKEFVKDFKNAKKLYGETIIRELSGYDPRFVEKNISIPEFQRDLKKRLKDSVDGLQERGILKKGGIFSPESLSVAALFLIDEEFQETYGSHSNFGEAKNLSPDRFGEKSYTRLFRKGDIYKDLAIKQSIKLALRRGHNNLELSDLQSFDRESQQKVNIIYALDISGSMKGEKLRLAKKAGVALAHKAMRDGNEVGLVLFESSIAKTVPLTKDLLTFTKPLAVISPGKETNIALAIDKSVSLLRKAKGIKHVVILTDGLHTTSDDPHKVVNEEISKAVSQDVSISVVGITLDPKGLSLAQEIVDRSNGKLHGVSEAREIGGVVIADYKSLNF
jgi:Mg-chelatase subunit ChlD